MATVATILKTNPSYIVLSLRTNLYMLVNDSFIQAWRTFVSPGGTLNIRTNHGYIAWGLQHGPSEKIVDLATAPPGLASFLFDRSPCEWSMWLRATLFLFIKTLQDTYRIRSLSPRAEYNASTRFHSPGNKDRAGASPAEDVPFFHIPRP
uniref:Cytochrome P450 n=1 Tax=Steinernema glaseri TaxID=37863 RepID=A0A1I8A1I3_9BILA